jgi:hypothetical protein
VFDIEGAARLSLREIINDYGAPALDDERLITSLLTDLLAGYPREATLIRAAARVRAASLLRAHAANRMPAHAAIEDVSVRLGHEALIEPNAARWIVTEYAVAVGLAGSLPASDPVVADPVVADPAPTRIDPPPSASIAAAVPAPPPTPIEAAPVAAAPVPAQPARASTPGPPEPAANLRSRGVVAAAAGLPVLIGLIAAVALSGNLGLRSYLGVLHGQWLLVAVPMTLSLIAVTAYARGGARAWRGTAAYVVLVYLGMTILPWLGGYGRPLDDVFRTLRLDFEDGVQYSGSSMLWVPVYAAVLAALTHAVMKRLGTVTRTGLLTALIPVFVALVANAFSSNYIIFDVYDAYFGSTGYLVLQVMLINVVCAGAILLSRVPRFGGR